MTQEKIRQITPELIQTSQNISKELGFIEEPGSPATAEHQT
jgi:hypothetical protein